MWLKIINIFCLLLVGSSLFAQPVGFEDFHEQRLAERRGKMSAFNSKISIDKAARNTAQRNYDVTYYRLNLIIEPTAFLLTGSVVMQGKSHTAGFNKVALDFAANMEITGVSGDAVSYVREDDLVTLTLQQPVASGETFSVQINYSGNPQERGFGGFVFDSQGGQPMVWTLSEPYYARSWWPCNDRPNDKADSVDIIVTVPSNLVAASNGTLVADTDNGDGTRTFHWQERYLITTYLVSLAITDYVKLTDWFRYSPTDSMEITNYVYPTTTNRSGLDALPDMLDFFHNIFGPYPFISEKYGVAQFGWGGGMEHQTLSSQGGFGEVLNAHELAHQWWGDMITNANWPEIWLNEGFASYSEALWFEHTRGKNYYHQYMSFMDWNYSGAIYRHDTTSVSSLFNGIVYDKGAWVLHMLRHVAGDSTFFDILQAYAEDPRFKYGNATTEGFKDVCETVSGLALDQFFDQWLYGIGRPFYSYIWGIQAGAGDEVNVDVSIDQLQVEDDRLYAMPIDILLEGAGRDTIVTVYNDAASQNFLITLPFEPDNLTLDPENWILKQVEAPFTSVEDADRVPGEFTLEQNYPNPFNAGTTISFLLQEPGSVEVKIYNLAGQLVRALTGGTFSSGSHRVTWDGTADSGKTLSSGIYIYRLTGEGFEKSQKMILMK